jgi:pseudaminic acid synthase
MKIGNRNVGPGQPPFVIAEVSCNHGGSLTRALELIEAAKACGADAVKFQAATAETITLKSSRPEFSIHGGPWDGQLLYDLYKKTETPFEWFPELAERARRLDIIWLASVFSPEAVDLVVTLGAPAIKIASFELVDTPLIEYAATKGRPIILSTGMASWKEIDEAIPKSMPLSGIALLHCVSGYPTKVEDADLTRMQQMEIKYSGWGHEQVIGISDHSVGIEIPIAATALGAHIVEKHFRLEHHPDTEDAPFSLCAVDFARMVTSVRAAWGAIQDHRKLDLTAVRQKHENPAEESSRQLRRSLFAVADIAQGEVFTSRNVRSIRPGNGLPPKLLPKVLGKVAGRPIERGEPLSWDMVKDSA